ncbi:MAG: hypothetical protein IKG88_04085 [Bacteroidales bacterium]|nr:hypothetical protein [Bacteroidales bacterium]
MRVLADTSGFFNQEHDNAEHVISVSTMGGQQVFDITGRQFSSFHPDGSAADCASFGITHIGAPSASLTKTQEPRSLPSAARRTTAASASLPRTCLASARCGLTLPT